MVSATLILAAHGAGDDSEQNRLVESLAARLRGARAGLQVLCAYNLGTPRFAEALALATSPRIVLVPLMTGPGYFVDERLPAELAKSPLYTPERVRIAAPLGTSAFLVEEVLARAVGVTRQVGQGGEAPTVLVVAHGTTRNPVSRTAANELAGVLTGRLAAAGRAVSSCSAVFLDEPPLLEDVVPTLPDGPIVVVPWLLGGGGHHLTDIRERLGERYEQATVLPPLAMLPQLDVAVLELFDRAAGEMERAGKTGGAGVGAA